MSEVSTMCRNTKPSTMSPVPRCRIQDHIPSPPRYRLFLYGSVLAGGALIEPNIQSRRAPRRQEAAHHRGALAAEHRLRRGPPGPGAGGGDPADGLRQGAPAHRAVGAPVAV